MKTLKKNIATFFRKTTGVVPDFRKGYDSLMMLKGESLRQTFAFYRLVRLRQRYIFTKTDTVRLRYVAGTAVVCCALLATAVNMGGPAPVRSQGYDLAALESRAGDDAPANVQAGDLQSGISEGMRKAASAIRKPSRPLNKLLTIGSGDTVGGLLQKAGLSGEDAYNATQALSEHYDPRKIKPGQEIKLRFKPQGADVQFSEMTIDVDPLKQVRIKKEDAAFVTDIKEKELESRTHARSTKIETSLYGSALRADIPAEVVAEVIRIYSWNIDFQRDIQPGDKIEVMYDAQETKDGSYAKFGNLLYANLSVGGKEIPIYRFAMADGGIDYFEPDGHSVRKVLMKTPIDGARISSGFGMRHHPILGYTKMHKGIDFAAATGTPIYAAGDGTVDFAGRKSGYGNYVALRHNSGLKTAYGHMSRIATGMRPGKRISQGDVIGYVGMTGQATGPHLHYEVLVSGKQVNPNSVNLPTGQQLAGKELKDFKALAATVHQQYVSLTAGLKFALRDTGTARNIQ